MSLADYVAVNISASGPGPSAPGFGVGLIAAYHTLGGANTVMGPYTGIDGVVADGFSTTGTGAGADVYNAALEYFAQSPKPSLLYVGRRSTYTQEAKLTPVNITSGTVYKINIGAVRGIGGTDITYTVPGGSPTLATVCTGLAAAITASAAGPSFTVSGASGTLVSLVNFGAANVIEIQMRVVGSTLKYAETRSSGTLAATLTADLGAIWAENKAWYGFGLDGNSDVEIATAAAWCEANGSTIFVASSSDTDIGNNSTTDIASTLKASSYKRTAIMFNQYSNKSYGAFGWLAVHLTQTPGSDTWHFNTVVGLKADSDTLVPESVVLAVQGKNATVYTTLANLNLTQGGTSAGGVFMDQTRFVDWQRVDMQLALVALLARNNGKVPYTDEGFALLEQTIKGSLERGVQNGGLVKDSYVILTPAVSTIATSDKLARRVPSLPWTAKLAGAVHSMTINGVASV